MQPVEKNQTHEIYFDQKYNLSKIKRELYQMIARSRKGEETGFYQIVDTLENLSFVGTTEEEYKSELLNVVNEMLELDEISFDLDKLYQIKRALSDNVG